MSLYCRFSELGPFRLRIFSAQVGNRTRTHGDESNPLEISMSSAMKGEPGLATGLTTLGPLHPFICAVHDSPVTETSVKRGSASYCSTEGVAPLHTAIPVPVIVSPVPVTAPQVSVTAPPVPVTAPPLLVTAPPGPVTASPVPVTAPPVPVTAPPVPVTAAKFKQHPQKEVERGG